MMDNNPFSEWYVQRYVERCLSASMYQSRAVICLLHQFYLNTGDWSLAKPVRLKFKANCPKDPTFEMQIYRTL